MAGNRRGSPHPEVGLEAHVDGQQLAFPQLRRGARVREAGDYRLEVRCRREQLAVRLTRADGGEMAVERLVWRLSAPLRNFSRTVLPDSGREYILKDRALYLRSQKSDVTAPNDGHPFLALLDQRGNLAVAFGLLTQLHESQCRCEEPKLSARMAMLGGADELIMRFTAPAPGWTYGRTAVVAESVFLATDYPTWFEAFRAYGALIRRRRRVRYPANPAAWEPTWCTWTAWCSDRLSPESVLANARVAKRLGVGTIILDDGWFGPGLDTDDRPLNIGDYYPDPAKFPDLRGLVDEVHGLGLRLLLWYAPTCIAPASRAFSRLEPWLMAHQGARVTAPNGFHCLCPCHPAARAFAASEVARMLTDYGVDGFKVDLYNTLPVTPCTAAHEHDCESVIEGVRRMMREQWDVCCRLRPQPLLELKQNYGNVLAAQYGTMVRAGDTAYDVDTNLWRCFYLQAYAPVTHNDYLAASVLDDPVDLAIMLIKQLAGGVPTLSLDLTRQPPGHLAVFRQWLRFYREHLPIWQGWREPQDGRLDVWRVAAGDTTMVIALWGAVEITLPETPRVLVLNATGREWFLVRTAGARAFNATWQDYRLRPVQAGRLRLEDRSVLPVRPGGVAVLEAK